MLDKTEGMNNSSDIIIPRKRRKLALKSQE